jgi:hypothetical protein
MRTLSVAGAALMTRLQAGERIPVVQLVELLLDVPQYVTTAGQNIAWDSKTWVATGLAVDVIEDSATDWNPITLILPGVTDAQLALALSEPIEGKTVRIYDALLDPDTGVVADAVLAWAGTLNVPAIEDGPRAVITVSAEHRATLAFRPKPSRYTNDEQQRLHPGDTCFDYDMQTDAAQIVWPAASYWKK